MPHSLEVNEIKGQFSKLRGKLDQQCLFLYPRDLILWI